MTRGSQLVSAALVAGGLLAAAGCGGGSSPSSSDLVGTTKTYFNDIKSGNCAAVESHFESAVKAQLSASSLCAAWTKYQHTIGTYQSLGAGTVVKVNGNNVVRLVLKLDNVDGEFRVSYDSAGLIAGIFFLKANVPL